MKSIRVLVLALFVLASLGLSGAALAQSAEQPPDNVKDKVIRNTPPNQTLPELLPRGQEDVAPGLLPFTGSDLTLFVVLGGVAIAVGSVLVRRGRSPDQGA
jgi:hypothetical protein